MNGYTILTIIALLFLAIYAYSYGSVYLDLQAKQRNAKEHREREEAMQRLKMRKQRHREENLQKIFKRRREINKRMKELERDNILMAQKFKNTIKIEFLKNNLKDTTQQQTG
ncbi:hypothetical protein ACKGJY_05475 [Hyunsoonleella sp. 2307UL5-6]|uniref:hypothetical protein n=1 Tax=Hyunsoonleella sp. 2307UL5-6 TaxID=3384768 RepID=UPI0039BC508F